MPKLAKTLRIERHGQSHFRMEIDGEEFPYYLAAEPIKSTIEHDGIGTVRLTLMAERVEIVDDSNEETRAS